MQYAAFLEEIFNSIIIASPGALNPYRAYIEAYAKGDIADLPQTEQLNASYVSAAGQRLNTGDPQQEATAIVSIRGLMTRRDSWINYGTETISALLANLYESDAVSAIILDHHNVGGSVDAIFPIKELAAKYKGSKPVFSLVNSQSFSLGVFTASLLSDKIFAVDKMARYGSIGVMAEIMNVDKFWEDMGIKSIQVYPPESDWKNKPSREAIKGKTKLLIEEELSPWAQHFQETVRASRGKKLNEDVEGTLNGRVFFAGWGEVNAMQNGLIDGIKTMDETIKYAARYNERKSFESFK